MTSGSAFFGSSSRAVIENVSVYTNTICVAKCLLGTPKPLNCVRWMQGMRSCGPHPSFSHSAFNAAAVSASMPSFRWRAAYQRVELSLCALVRGVGACRLHSDGRSRRCGRNCLRRLLYGARLWPRCRNVITRYNTFASVICKVQWTLRRENALFTGGWIGKNYCYFWRRVILSLSWKGVSIKEKIRAASH